MATIQAKTSHGRKYWYIVESRRVNGKPRPIVLAYLGKPEDLLRRLQGIHTALKVKSYSHGLIAILLKLAQTLNIVQIINKHVKSQRHYMARKPLRNNLTVGATLLFAAMGRVCLPTSKRSWFSWASTTSLAYLLRVSLNKIDSQHFWDMMDCLPVGAIEKIEQELLANIMKQYDIKSDTLFYDTTNFYTFIATENDKCTIAQRGKNKQKRTDLRQVGLAMVVTREDFIPIFHFSYRGNITDSPVFKEVISRIKQRMQALNMDVEKHTLVFDRGCNSKENLDLVERQLKMYYVGALTPYHHKQLIEDAEAHLEELRVGEDILHVFRDKRNIWDKERTVLVFISKKLKAGQLRGVYTSIDKRKQALKELQEKLDAPRARKRNKKQLREKIENIIKGQFMSGLFQWKLTTKARGYYRLTYCLDQEKLKTLEDRLGFRIIMTNRHDWDSASIIQSYYGQSIIEHAFTEIKNPYHLAFIPEFHWTDQKIQIHFLGCTLGLLFSSIIRKLAKEQAGYSGNLDNLLDMLNNIRLATLLEQSDKRGRNKATYVLEEMSETQQRLMQRLGIIDYHLKPIKLDGVGVYN